MAPGEVLAINLPATPASFTGWTAHAEVGAGGEGSESGGEHSAGGEHGSGRESGGEHGERWRAPGSTAKGNRKSTEGRCGNFKCKSRITDVSAR